MATIAALQAHYDQIIGQTPVLPLAAAPKGFAQLDIAALADSAASAAEASRTLSKASAGVQQCQVCGCRCNSSQLGFLVQTRVDFASRSVQAAAGQFACEVCRALSNPALLLELSTAVPQSEDFSRAEQLRELYLHFAAVNAAPAHITANSEALALWVQELACRAYSMHVVASSLKGWKLLGPDGQAVQPGLHGAALQLLQQLLLGEPGNCGQGQAAVGTAAAAGGGRGSKAAAAVPALVSKGQLASAPSKSKKKHKLQQGQQQGHDGSEVLQVKRKPAAAVETGSSKKKAKTSMAGAAAAELAVEAKQVAKLLKQQVKTPKQPQQQHAAKTKQQADMPTQQQQQQARTPKQQARTPLQHQRQPDSAVVKKKKKSSHDEAAAPAAIPGKKVKAAAAAAAKQTILFQTPQAPKAHKKVAKPVKRRLSDPR